METHSVIDGDNSEEQQQSQAESTIRPTLSQVKKSWGFRRSTIAKREFMEEVGDLTHSPPLVRRGRSRRANQTPETTTEPVTTQRAIPPTRSVIEDLEWSAPSSPVLVESRTGLEASAAESLDPSLWQDFGSAFHTAFSLLGGNEDLSMDIPDALAAPDILDATNSVDALPSQAIGETAVSDVLESAEDMEFSLPAAPNNVEGGEIEDIISNQEVDSDEMTLMQLKQQLATKGSQGDIPPRGRKGTRGRAKGKGRGKGRGRAKSKGRGRGRGRAVALVSSIADVQESDDDVILVNPCEQQQKLQEEDKTNNPHMAAIESSPAHSNSSTQHSSTDCIMVDTDLDQITDVIPGQCSDASEGEEDQKEQGEEKEEDLKIVREYSSISDTEGYDSNALCCICRKKHNNRFMICCDSCQEWFHGDCIGISGTQGCKMEGTKQEFICPTCNTKKQLQSESPPQREPELSFFNCLTPSLSGEEGEGHEDRHVLKETVAEKVDEEKTPVIMLKPEVQEEMESNDSAALCIGPGCSKQALPDSGYCGTDCILQHAAATMKALSDVNVPKSRGRTQKKAPVITSITRGQRSTRTSKRLAGKAKEEGEKEAAMEEGCTDAESSLACDPSLTEVQAPCIPSSQFCTVSEKDLIEVKPESEAVTSLPHSPGDTTDAAPSSQIVSDTDPLHRNSEEEKVKDLEKEHSAEVDPSISLVPAKSPPSPVIQSSSNLASHSHGTGALMVSKTSYVIPKKQAGAQPPSTSHISATASGQKTSSTPALLNEPRNLPVSPAPSAPSSRPAQPNNQIRQSIQRSLTSILLKRLSDCEDLEMSESEVAKLVASFEMEMFDIFRNTDSKYMNKYRTIMFNLKDPKNKGLLYRVVCGEISPFRLVRMSQKDMQATKAPEPRAKGTEPKEASAKAPTLLRKPEAVKVDLPSLPCSARPDRRPDGRPSSKPDSTVTSQEQTKSVPAPAVKARANQPSQGRAVPDILTCMLKDTTSEHKAHLFDVKCRICTGQILAEDEDEPARKKSRVSETRDKLESSWRRSAGGDSPLHAPPDSPDMDSSTSSLTDPTSRLIIDSPALTIAESPASPTTDSPASPVLDSPASPVMDYPASPTQDTCNSTKPKRTYTPVVIPAVSTVTTITRRDPRTAASRFSAMSHNTVQNKTAAFAPGKQPSSALSITPESSLPSMKIVPKSILMKPSSSADPRLFGTSSRTMIPESPGDGGTAQFLAKQEVMWKGFLNMITVAKFATKAYLVSGCVENLKADLPDTIQIGGRILPQTVWDYVLKLKTTVSKELCVIRFHPATEEEEVAYVSLFSYFSSRGRFGVVANNSNSIKDVYLVPLSAKESIPSILQPLIGPGLEKNRPNLLLGLAIVQKAKRPGMLSQEIEEKRPSVHISKDPMWIPKPPVLYGSDKLEIFQPYDPETPTSTSPSASPSRQVSQSDSSCSGSVTLPSLLTSMKSPPPVSISAVVAATQSTSSTISDTDPLTAHSDKTPLQTILKSLFGNKENDSTDSCDGSSTVTTDKVIPVFSQVSQSLVDPIVQQYGQMQKSKVKEIEQEENDLDRPYDPEEEYDPAKGYGRVASQSIEKQKKDNSALSGLVDDDVAYDPEDETIFDAIQSDTIVTRSNVQKLDSAPTPPSTTHSVVPSATSTPAQPSNPVTLIPNLPTGTVVVSAATLTEQQRMLEELNKQIEEQKRQLKEQEEALRQQREAVGMFMAHFSVSDSLMSPPQKSLPVSQLSSQTTDKTSNSTATADTCNVNSQTLKQDDTTAFPSSISDTVTVQDETQELAKESDKYSSAGEIEDSDVAYDPEDESLFNEIQEDVFHGSSMNTRAGLGTNRKGASPNSHHSRKRRLSPKRRGHRERDRRRSPSKRSQRRSPTHSQRRRERDRHRRRHRSRDQSGRRKDHSTRHHSRGHRRSSSSPRKHSVSLSPKKHRETSPQGFEQIKHTDALCDATASIIGSDTLSATSVTIKNDPDGHLLKCDLFDSIDKDASPCSSELLHKDFVSDNIGNSGPFTSSKQDGFPKDKFETPVPLREIDPPIRESPESPDPEPQFMTSTDVEKTDSIRNEEKPQIHVSVELPPVKVENNCLSICGQAALYNIVKSTMASPVSVVSNLVLDLPGPGIRDQSTIEVDTLKGGVNTALNNLQKKGQEGHHSQSYPGSDSQASQPEMDLMLKYSGSDMQESGHKESRTGIGLPGPDIRFAGMQGLSPNIWGPGTHIQQPGMGMQSSESNIREPGFQYLKTDRFVVRASEVKCPVQNIESASMQTMNPEAHGPDIRQSTQAVQGQKSVTADTNSHITSLDSKSNVIAVGEDQSFVGPQIEIRAQNIVGRGRGQNNRGGMRPFTMGGGVRGPDLSFGPQRAQDAKGAWPKKYHEMFCHESSNPEAHFNDPCSKVMSNSGANNTFREQDTARSSDIGCVQVMARDMQGNILHNPGLEWTNEQVGQDYRGPKQDINNADWKGPGASNIVSDMGGQRNQNEAINPHMNDLNWSGPESGIRDDWGGNDRRGSSSIPGRPFIQNEWIAHQHDRREPNMENLGPERGPREFIAPGFGKRGPEMKDQAMDTLGSGMRGHGIDCTDFALKSPGTDRRGHQSPCLIGVGPENQGQGHGMRGLPGPDFRGPCPERGGPDMINPGTDRKGPEGQVIWGHAPERRGPSAEGPRTDRREIVKWGQGLENDYVFDEGLGPGSRGLKGPAFSGQGPDRRGPGDSDIIGSGCEKRGPSFERRGPDRIGPGDENSGLMGPNRRRSYIESPRHERSGQQMEHQNRGRRGLHFRGPGPEGGNQNIEGPDIGVRGLDFRGPWLEGQGMESLGPNKTDARYFRGGVDEQRPPDMVETENNSSFSGGPRFRGPKQERRLSEEDQQASCFRPVQLERTIRGQGSGPKGLYLEGSGPDWRRSNCSDFRDPDIGENIEGEWGGSDFGMSKPTQGTPGIEAPGLEITGHSMRGPRHMRRKLRGRGKDIRSLNHGDRWKSTDTVDQWSDKKGPYMETENELEISADNWKRHGNMDPDEYDQDLSSQGPHGDWRGPVRWGPGLRHEESNMQFSGQDDWSHPGCQDPPPIQDNPDMMYPAPSRGGPGNEWKGPDIGISGPDRRGPGPFFRRTRDSDNVGQCHDRVGVGPRGLEMGKRSLNHRGGPDVREFEVEGLHKTFMRSSDSRHPGSENKSFNVESPGSMRRFPDCRGLGSESLGPGRKEFEHDFRGERRGPGLRPGSWNTNTTMGDPGLDSRGLEKPMKSDVQGPDIRGPGRAIREPDMRHREPVERGQTERSHPSLRHFDKQGLHNLDNSHQVARFQSPSEQHSAPFNRPPAPNSGGKPSYDSPQNEQGVKPQKHRAALLPTPTEGLIHFPNNPDVFRQKQEQMGRSAERKWGRGRPAIHRRNMFKGRQEQDKSHASKINTGWE